MTKKVIKIITNKYFITGFIFLIWTAFFDQNDWLTLQQRQKELNGLKDDIAYLNAEIAKMNAEKNDLDYDNNRHMLNNPAKLEQYARENYHMKHDGEDVYVIESTK